MKVCLGSLGVLGVASAVLFAIGGPTTHENEKETAMLSPKSYPKWTINLPKETYSAVASEFPIAHSGGSGFHAEIDGTALAVDTNADGKLDTKAKGAKAYLVLKGKSTLGRDFSYAVRMVNEGGWKFASSTVMAGRVKGVDVRLIDQDNNGRFDDFGKDAMVIGDGDAASYLSKVVNLGGSLYSIEVSADGAQVTASPYAGDAGTLNLLESFTAQGKLESAVVNSTDGEFSFNLADAKQGMLVPTGEYAIEYGTVTAGAEIVRIRPGKMKPLSVKKDATIAPKWGGPIRAEFTYTHENGVLTIKPENLFFFGQAGEQYYDWKPDGQPPTFIVKDAKTGQEILKARFGGC